MAVTDSRWVRVRTRNATAKKVMTESMSKVMTRAMRVELRIADCGLRIARLGADTGAANGATHRIVNGEF